jgi:hypothetical protein
MPYPHEALGYCMWWRQSTQGVRKYDRRFLRLNHNYKLLVRSNRAAQRWDQKRINQPSMVSIRKDMRGDTVLIDSPASILILLALSRISHYA